ncbi:MurR/RpiR family transcriptional regulator [Paraburkholderia phytofirmans]|uniref:MurR/RpiR family transcriptional regulator n=1 Tax=Paraburkholderia phytofirmans TaxID=261302 RepID=UPI0038B98944
MASIGLSLHPQSRFRARLLTEFNHPEKAAARIESSLRNRSNRSNSNASSTRLGLYSVRTHPLSFRSPRMPQPEHSFVGRIRLHLDEMPATERRLADFVLEFPGDLASYTGAELAQLASVSKATVSRFVRRLGYDTFEDARRDARNEKERGSPLFLSASSKSSSVLEAHINLGMQNLTATLGRLSDELVDEIARSVVDARQVPIFGFRSSHAFASYFRWQIQQVVERAVTLPAAGETLGEQLAGLDERDMVIVFGMRRRVPQTQAVLDYVTGAGIRTLYIADQHAPAHRGATWTLHCDTAAPGPLDSHVAVMGLCNVLITRIFERAGNRGKKRLSAIEAAHDRLDEL